MSYFDNMINDLKKTSGRFGCINFNFDLTNSSVNNFNANGFGALEGFTINDEPGINYNFRLDDEALNDMYKSALLLLIEKNKKIKINVDKYPTIELKKLNIRCCGVNINVMSVNKEELIEKLDLAKEIVESNSNSKNLKIKCKSI
jgi:hypothetical protein